MRRPSDDLYLTADQVSERLHVPPRTLETWRAAGDGPPWLRLTDRRNGPVRYPRDAMDRWLSERMEATASKRRSSMGGQ